MEIRRVRYGSEQYDEIMRLRDRVMRKPLGHRIEEEDFSWEKDAVTLGAYENGVLVGSGVLSHKENLYKVQYLCVEIPLQGRGIGGAILRELEKLALENNADKMWMEARVSAQKFYEKAGYTVVDSESYLIDAAPVAHVIMEKVFKR